MLFSQRVVVAQRLGYTHIEGVLVNDDYKILILAYLIGHSPIETQQTFQMQGHLEVCQNVKQIY